MSVGYNNYHPNYKCRNMYNTFRLWRMKFGTPNFDYLEAEEIQQEAASADLAEWTAGKQPRGLSLPTQSLLFILPTRSQLGNGNVDNP